MAKVRIVCHNCGSDKGTEKYLNMVARELEISVDEVGDLLLSGDVWLENADVVPVQ